MLHFFVLLQILLTDLLVRWKELVVLFFEEEVSLEQFDILRIDLLSLSELVLKNLNFLKKVLLYFEKLWLLLLLNPLKILNFLFQIIGLVLKWRVSIFPSGDFSLLFALKFTNLLRKTTDLLDVILMQSTHLLEHFNSEGLSLSLVRLRCVF